MNNTIDVQVCGNQRMFPCTYKTVVLKPNIINDKNILNQGMMNMPNTKYVIKYDFLLSDAIVEKTVNVVSTNVSQCGNAAYAETLAAYNLAHDAWIDADNAYTNDPNDTTLAAKNAAYAALEAAQLTLNGTPQYYYFAGSAINIKKGQHITIPEGCVLLNDTRNGIVSFDVAPNDMTVYIGSATTGNYNYKIQGGIVMPANCLIEFDGGSISDGVLVGDETILIFDQEEEVVLKNVELLGDFIYPSSNAADKKDNTDGMAKIYLKKNKSFASQVTQINTIYVIQYDFDLGGESITIPENCVLEFDGGSLSNGTLIGNGTGILRNATNYIFGQIDIAGTWNVPYISTDYFNDSHQINRLQNIFKLCNDDVQNTIVIEAGDYYFKSDEESYEAISSHSNVHLIINGNIYLDSNNNNSYRLFSWAQKSNIHISGSGKLEGDRASNTSEGEWGHGIWLSDCSDVVIEGIAITKMFGDGINLYRTCKNVEIKQCNISWCRRNGISIYNCYNCNIHNNTFEGIGRPLNNIEAIEPKCAIEFEADGVPVYDSHGLFISNNIFENCCKCVFLNNKYTLNGITFQNNKCVNILLGLGIGDTSGIIPGEGKISNIVVSNNFFENVSERAIGISEDNVIITSNTIEDVINVNSLYPSVVVLGSFCSISNNKIKSKQSIKVKGNYNKISNNSIDSYAESTRDELFVIDGYSNTIFGNFVKGHATIIIRNGGLEMFSNYFQLMFNKDNYIHINAAQTDGIKATNHIYNNHIEGLSETIKSTYGIYLRRFYGECDNNFFTNVNNQYIVDDGTQGIVQLKDYKVIGTNAERPPIHIYDARIRQYYSGFQYFNTELNKLIVWNGTRWIDTDGIASSVARSGATGNRPAGSLIKIGFVFFDLTINKPIYASVISGDTVTWVDATGTPV